MKSLLELWFGDVYSCGHTDMFSDPMYYTVGLHTLSWHAWFPPERELADGEAGEKSKCTRPQ